MTTYAILKAQLKALNDEAKAARQRELEQVLCDIRAAVERYAIAPEQIYGNHVRMRIRDGRRGPLQPKYRDPETGQTWCGRGRLPRWLVGRCREDFLVEQAI
ncbi:H-NS histone family protein (plasmid) [Burkholderia sp. FERM BP-3421]|jgi:DNA-binding protein H-NS|uniref:H-NS histone family protein n=1 Tax=Burkholderia sp. FERM BP-3421 TaxID=1494466 RepID=UPI0023621283|nr:H-NS histone family protein [Burkholderia sp. FERM BP-3421]WDD90707.1 H-NS histone family protein [Burkholderia sp. FERM BP-3421]